MNPSSYYTFLLTAAFPDNASILIQLNGFQYSGSHSVNFYNILWCESNKAAFYAIANFALFRFKCRTSAWLPSLHINFNDGSY